VILQSLLEWQRDKGEKKIEIKEIDHIARSIANCYADQEMSVITTYLNDIAQTPLN